MEEYLRGFRPRTPSGALRSRILDSARREAATPPSVMDRLWSSRAFWSAAAAAILIGVTLSGAFAPAAPAVASAQPSAEILETADSIAALAGDGPVLAKRFAGQLSGSAAPSMARSLNADNLLEDLACQG